MPRYVVIEKRALHNAVLIEAENEQDARGYKGDIIDESETDTWGDELLSVEEVPGDTDEIPEGTL